MEEHEFDIDKLIYCRYKLEKEYKGKMEYLECGVDADGIIWIKCGDRDWERPCMKLCYDTVSAFDKACGKAVLSKSCDIQNDGAINARALVYDEERNYIEDNKLP